MITRVSIKDFQRIRSLLLDLGPGVTCLVGPTDAGKSSVLRAVVWAITNRPSGDEMIRWAQDRARVEVTLGGHTILRIRGSKKNVYLLDKKRYVAFGMEPPEDVTWAAAMDSVNFQTQLDRHFWFSETPGKVSKELNRIIDLSVIDLSLANAAKETKDAAVRLEVAKERSQEANGTSSRLKWVPGMVEAFGALSVIRREEGEARARAVRISELMLRVTVQDAVAVGHARMHKKLSRLNNDAGAVKQRKDRLSLLTKLVAGINEAAEVSTKTPDIGRIDCLFNAVKESRAEIESLEKIIRMAAEQESVRCRNESSITTLLASIQEGTRGMCPVCGGPLGHPGTGRC